MLDRAALFTYGGILTALIAAGLGFPIPEEVPIVVAGVSTGHSANDRSREHLVTDLVAGLALDPNVPFPAAVPLYYWSHLNPDPVVPLKWYIFLPVCILGVVISDGLLYGMGRLWGTRLLETAWMKRLLPTQKKLRIEENFHRFGVWVLLFARFLPTIRAPIFIMAGVMRVPASLFLLADGLYAIPGVSLLFFLGFWFGDQFKDLIFALEGRIAAARPILVLLGLIAITIYLIWHFFRHPVATGDPREEIPVIGEQVAARMDHSDPATPPIPQGSREIPVTTQAPATAPREK